MAIRTSIGKELYLFQDNSGKPAENLLITSHGGYFARPEFGKQTGKARNVPGLGGWLDVPAGVTLHFYGPHKMVLIDPRIVNVVDRAVHHLEKCRSPEKVRNYRLSKYQSEANRESYDSIKKAIDNNRDNNARRDEAIQSGDQDALRLVERACPNPFPTFDVLTIRNRFWMASVTLHDVFERLRNEGRMYTEIHCVFCRSRILGQSKEYQPLTF